ncbi:phenylalanine--tRNA ligase beta subunit-related protein [Robertmurraya massiliosenegalensis]|uniref:B3/B4 domain-containing protein n=1 Tax=Robertmurraya TaxID=2837507 RepID=UPI0039A693A6
MEITLSPQLYKLIPNFKIGVIHYRNIEVGASPQMLKGRLQLFQESIFFDLEDKNVADIEEIKEWRSIFKKTGKDPNLYQPTVETLYRKVQKQEFLHSVNSAIDLTNFFSLQYKIPLGIYDLDAVEGPISIRIGDEEDAYEGLIGRMNDWQQLIVAADNAGPFGSPLVDSARTSVSQKTKEAIQIVYLRPSISLEDAGQMVESLRKMFVQIHGGEASFEIFSDFAV